MRETILRVWRSVWLPNDQQLNAIVIVVAVLMATVYRSRRKNLSSICILWLYRNSIRPESRSKACVFIGPSSGHHCQSIYRLRPVAFCSSAKHAPMQSCPCAGTRVCVLARHKNQKPIVVLAIRRVPVATTTAATNPSTATTASSDDDQYEQLEHVVPDRINPLFIFDSGRPH